MDDIEDDMAMKHTRFAVQNLVKYVRLCHEQLRL